ncbi:hypothetical protein BS50DRAFT_579976 [Corynespora cassiicola Philippines]|uniref:CENP-V/GFA domain-containing protein n=1 Tax=Corynespora cassiicola Philippines TaxID=1448308 RepID=A0A2T2N2X9_CORCC|nr:hypothetical protein BS50DRAFT_579976 [Corynespora cassiicola Philippines]
MGAEGRCNCGAIKVTISELPAQSLICYCSNCRRAGSSAFSANYFVEKANVDVSDPKGALKSYDDNDTKSGNTIIREFCSICGSGIMTLPSRESPKAILKAGLFDEIPPPAMQVFDHEKPAWLKIEKL